jgi:hypothetical protein
MAKKGKRPLDKHDVRIFGCDRCSLLIFHHVTVSSVTCPSCKQTIDVYAQYRNIAFAEGIQIRIPEMDAKKLLSILE